MPGHLSEPKELSDPIDCHVGLRVRELRIIAGVSQVELAQQMGISVSQLYKYERGSNRLSAARLWHAARALNMPMDRFFEAVPGQWENYPPKDLREVRPMTREAYRTAKMICELTDPVKRNALRYVIRAMLPKAKRKGHSPELSGV